MRPRLRLPLGARTSRTPASASPAPPPASSSYGFYGTDLSNRVVYLGEEGPHGAFNAIPTCAAFRAAVNDADLDYLVTSPFLNFLHPSDPIALAGGGLAARRAGGRRRSTAAAPVTVWRVDGRLDPAACGPANAPPAPCPDTPGV